MHRENHARQMPCAKTLMQKSKSHQNSYSVRELLDVQYK